ncbi:sensor histidine kinase [Chryseobacterium nematophagum]|uniref:histidine kinase n=1 Tax=Chryseobacterium nematophagum TaxID=2305228 RepID=A0A3M7LBX0_9FLAO|nr:HAMP domain-containing sensor histidine kinase [Chryseobacterium nematophagum]RMZ60258.1 sensor histidine kinase [Chryseobacterium nematophagum]
MKPLLSKITTPFIIYVLIILGISIPVYYWVVDTIWKGELDEHNKTIAEKTAYEFNHLKLSDEELDKSILLWKSIQPETNIERVTLDTLKRDLYFTLEKPELFTNEFEIERYRGLKKILYINNRPFLFTIQTNIEESQETIAVIAITTAFFFLIIVLGLLLLNRRLSVTVWEPFRKTLEELKNFNLNHHNNITFETTYIKEFEELHQSLNKLIDHSVSVYKRRKEFTENASHELQTPLAIIKYKIDILLQDENLTEKQYLIAEDINHALTRSARINKDLLLLTKIENNQFDNSETIQFDQILNQSIEILDEHFKQKDITVTSDIATQIIVNGNSSLIEILINNLLINAIRHTPYNGFISITLRDQSFEVANSGTEKLDNDLLFKRFSKLSKNSKGNGLGLSIVKEIGKHMQWTIDYKFKNNNHIFIVNL